MVEVVVEGVQGEGAALVEGQVPEVGLEEDQEGVLADLSKDGQMKP